MNKIILLIAAIIGGFTGLATAITLTVSWKPQTDCVGFNISYDTPSSTRWETPCGPYEYSSIGVSVVTTSYDIVDAQDGYYSVYVRAYNYYGNMSGYVQFAFNLSNGVVSTSGVSEPTPDCVPVAMISITSTIGHINNAIQFNGSGTNNPTSWVWTFGDGSAESIIQNTSHTYSTIGIYDVSLTATNSTWWGRAWTTMYILGMSSGMSGCKLIGGGIR